MVFNHKQRKTDNMTRQIKALPEGKRTPLTKLLMSKMYEHGYTLTSLGKAVGGYQTAVVARVVKGDMRIPLNKIGIFAKTLKVSPLRLFKLAYPELIDVMQEIFGSFATTKNEQAIIETVRRVSNNNDAHPETVDELQGLENLVKQWSNRQTSDENNFEEQRDQFKRDRNYPDFEKLYENKSTKGAG